MWRRTPTSHREHKFFIKLRRNKYVTAIPRLGFKKTSDSWLETMARRASTEHHWRTDTSIINVTSLQPLTISASRKRENQSLKQNGSEILNSNSINNTKSYFVTVSSPTIVPSINYPWSHYSLRHSGYTRRSSLP
jgi:hypothetical protein